MKDRKLPERRRPRHPKEYLGRGWAFPFRFDPATGGVAMTEYEDNIRQCISLILSTRPGERQMLPAFGCRIHELLFAPNTRATAAAIEHHVREALTRWEPRIEVRAVHARTDPQGAVHVEVEYMVRATRAVETAAHVITGPR